MINNPEEEQAVKKLVEQIVRLDIQADEYSEREYYGESISCHDKSNALEDDLETYYGATLVFQHDELVHVWRDSSIYAVFNFLEWEWLTEQQIQELPEARP